MRRTFERTMQVLLWGVGITIVWAAIALTDWGRQRSPLGTGPGYLDAIAPLTYVAGALLVSVTATLLVQALVGTRKRRGRPVGAPVRRPRRHRSVGQDGTAGTVGRPVRDRIGRGRTWNDLPARPPAPDDHTPA